MCPARMNDNSSSTRKPYTLSIKLDPRAQDQLKWIEEALKWIAPDVRLSSAVLIRRAIAAYVERLEYITGPDQKQGGMSQKGEAAKLMNFTQPQPVYWPDGVFPEDQLKDGDGRPVAWRLLESQHRSAKHKRNINALLEGGK